MNEASGIEPSNWIWGAVWIFYALFYGRYFTHVASRLKPDLKFVEVQGSPERLGRKSRWCKRFAVFMTIATVLELIRSTDFTHGIITFAPCLFGLWVMHAIWSEIFQSKVPKAAAKANKFRERS